ncbi:MAG: ribose 5-phosphate isomerase B [Desulfobulbus sp.]|jgi:ribose 5-phosphate isomerase B|uniref:ribose 5-phosphate isomerase B n=1 Tax=Desulfobulbus sp. TaxID=895 RepID=UPI0028477E27|nr:ribose 5-phosphate isomerase B [Desulfobulbus sp.]MDR2550555.1 ribose 5-phosphate isomerase B [Desulfobulbus sp.]
MNIAIGCDHAGFDLKKVIVPIIEQAGHTVVDLGCSSVESVDYPDFANRVCATIGEGHCQGGILICGTGIGMSIAANRHRHIRAALCHESFTARMSREHNDANVLCLAARVVGSALIQEIVKVWLTTEFAGGRHLRRIEMMG